MNTEDENNVKSTNKKFGSQTAVSVVYINQPPSSRAKNEMKDDNTTGIKGGKKLTNEEREGNEQDRTRLKGKIRSRRGSI